MRVVCVISSLGTGGAERVMTLLTREFVSRGCQVALVTLTDPADDYYDLAGGIRRIGLDLMQPSRSRRGALDANFRRVRRLRAVLRREQPEVVVSFIAEMNVITAFASLGLTHRLIVSERVDPGAHRLGRAWEFLRRVAYRRAQAVVVQTARAAEWFATRGVARARLSVVPNPVVPLANGGPAAVDLPEQFVLGAGRLVRQKGFDVLIEAFSLIAAAHPSLELVICGDGPERDSLLEQAGRLGVAERVRLPGRTDLGPVLARARLFVLASRFEGFPNVLLEALALGVPAIATDCPSGPREILGSSSPEALVPVERADAMAELMQRTLTDADFGSQLATRGRSLTDAYTLDRVADSWVSLMRGNAP